MSAGRLFGTDHLYRGDPFNEINPPIERFHFLAGHGASHLLLHAVADSGAVWLLQGWFLYYRRVSAGAAGPRAARRGADDRMVVLDLWGDPTRCGGSAGVYGKPGSGTCCTTLAARSA